MSKLDKIITMVSTPAMETAAKVIETTGKGSVLTGGTIGILGTSDTATEVVAQYSTVWTITDYAAAVSIAGGLVWIAKLTFDVWLSYQKHKRSIAE